MGEKVEERTGGDREFTGEAYAKGAVGWLRSPHSGVGALLGMVGRGAETWVSAPAQLLI